MNPMKPYVIAAAVLAIAAVAAVFVLSGSRHGSGTSTIQAAQATTSVQGQSQAQSNATLFSSSPYASYAYLISDPTLSQQAQAALAGFSLNVSKLANGTTSVSISPKSGQGTVIMLQPGYKLYFIEAAFGDDGYGFDSSLADEGLIEVNQTGYIV